MDPFCYCLPAKDLVMTDINFFSLHLVVTI